MGDGAAGAENRWIKPSDPERSSGDQQRSEPFNGRRDGALNAEGVALILVACVPALAMVSGLAVLVLGIPFKQGSLGEFLQAIAVPVATGVLGYLGGAGRRER